MVSTETEPLVKEHLAGQLKDAILQGQLSPGQRGRSARGATVAIEFTGTHRTARRGVCR